MLSKEFFTAGRAVFTLSVPPSFVESHPECRDRYTFKVVFKPASERWPDSYFVNLLTGPDNTSNYSPLGKLNPETGAVKVTRNSNMNDESWPVRLIRRVFARVWQDDLQAVLDANFELRHAGYCGRCSRPLTVPESIDSGLGPICMQKMGL